MTGTALVIGAMVTVLGTPALQSGSPRVAADATVQPPEATATAESIAATAVLLAEVRGPDGEAADFSIPSAAADFEQPAKPVTAPAEPMGKVPDNQPANGTAVTEAAIELPQSAELMARVSTPAEAVDATQFNRENAPWAKPGGVPAASDTQI